MSRTEKTYVSMLFKAIGKSVAGQNLLVRFGIE